MFFQVQHRRRVLSLARGRKIGAQEQIPSTSPDYANIGQALRLGPRMPWWSAILARRRLDCAVRRAENCRDKNDAGGRTPSGGNREETT